MYAQSWALTHMLLLGQPRRNDRLGEHWRRVDQGTPPSDAWDQVFGADPIERDLLSYVRQQRFFATQHKFPEKVATFEANAVTLSPGDADAFLADFLIQRTVGGSRGTDEERSLDADRVASDSCGVARHGEQERRSRGKALVSMPDVHDWLTAHAPRRRWRRWSRGGDQPRPEHVNAARRLLQISRAADREMAIGIARLVALELATRIRHCAEPQRHRARPDDGAGPRRVSVSARSGADTREGYAAARMLIGPMMSPVQPPEIRDYARRLMAYVGDIERAESGLDFGAGRAHGRHRPILRPAVRPTGPPDGVRSSAGPKRTRSGSKGSWTASTAAVVWSCLRSPPPPPVRLVAATLSLVDFITYRDDLGGTVRCAQSRTVRACTSPPSPRA